MLLESSLQNLVVIKRVLCRNTNWAKKCGPRPVVVRKKYVQPIRVCLRGSTEGFQVCNLKGVIESFSR